MNIVDCTQCTHDKVCKYQQKKEEILKLYEHHHPEYPFVMKFECKLFSQIVSTPRSDGWGSGIYTGDPIVPYTVVSCHSKEE